MALVERVPYLFLVFAALWLPRLKGSAAIAIFLALIVWKGLAAGMMGLPWQELIATVIPVWLRGRFFGISHFLGKLVGLGSAAIAGVILARLEYPNNYAVIFLLGFVGVMVSYVFLILTVEPEVKRAPDPDAIKTAFSAQLWGILKEDRNFRLYLFSRALSYLGGMASGFVAVYGIKHFGLPDAYAALFTSVIVGFSTVGFIGWGALGDRLGHKFILIGSSLLWISALAVLLLVPEQWGLYVVFALMGLSQPGNMIGDLNMAMEFDSGPRRPSYIGLARTLTAPVLLTAPVMAGVVVGWSSYPVMFGVSLGFALCALVALLFGVTDPRRKTG
jgi:Na+/melibiose symporter-like transporter